MATHGFANEVGAFGELIRFIRFERGYTQNIVFEKLTNQLDKSSNTTPRTGNTK